MALALSAQETILLIYTDYFFFLAIQKLSLRVQWLHLVFSEYITLKGWNWMDISASVRWI